MENKVQILVIADDEPADRLLLKMAIEEVGLNISIIEKMDGKEALDFFEKECSIVNPSLILLDINMPVFTGFEVLERSQKNHSLCSTPVIIFTTSNTEHDQKKSIELGISRFVTKPLDYTGYLAFAQELKQFFEERAKSSK